MEHACLPMVPSMDPSYNSVGSEPFQLISAHAAEKPSTPWVETWQLIRSNPNCCLPLCLRPSRSTDSLRSQPSVVFDLYRRETTCFPLSKIWCLKLIQSEDLPRHYRNRQPSRSYSSCDTRGSNLARYLNRETPSSPFLTNISLQALLWWHSQYNAIFYSLGSFLVEGHLKLSTTEQ